MFSKKNFKDIPIECTSHSTGSRKLLVGKGDTSSKYFEALSYGYLPVGVKWEMHKHKNIVEICVVVKGQGIIRDSQGQEVSFTVGDRFIFPANTKHEIENNSDVEAEFCFMRFQDR